MTIPIRMLDVKPKLPREVQSLGALSENLWFVWNYDAESLFRSMNADLWEETRENPVELLCRLRQEELKGLAEDQGFRAHLDRVKREFDRYMSERPDPKLFGPLEEPFSVAYLTAECGVADCLPIYSGGLGILAGDHLKSASDLNYPVIGLSLAYQKGYFRQYLIQDGWQMESYPMNQFSTMPMTLVRNAEGLPINVSIDLKGEEVKVQVWQVNLGRTKLFLLDTNLKENSAAARGITSELYGGDREMRIRQEIILGIGGVRMLRAMGISPAVVHMNEGHSAFAAFERIRELRETAGLTFNEAVEYVRVTSVFTTHTPVPAGIDNFHPDLVRTYLDGFARAMGLSINVLLGFGRLDPRNKDEEFSMAVLALRLSNWSNGVSRLHGTVSRKMFQKIWSRTPEEDLPISHVTNGVHIPSFVSKGMAEHFDRYLSPRWIEDPDNVKIWERVDKIPDTEIWRTHERGRERLVAFTRSRLRKQLAKRGASDRELAFADDVLNTESLTIGFARRFAPYKRAHLILKDIARLERILTNASRPAQIIFAGKAHPQDEQGKDLIKQLVQTSNRETLRRHMVFLEDYDLDISRTMVQGCDVWLNTPRRPFEACGTSGMKAVANGALHMSVLDGWWDEGYERGLGWAIGNGEEYQDYNFQDDLESRALYDILEKEVVPIFYERGADGIPRRWVGMMKASMHKLCPIFNTHRMVSEYWERFYLPSAVRGAEFKEKEWGSLKKLSKWREKLMYNWSNIAIKNIRMEDITELEVGDPYLVEADILLGDLFPEDVMVEAYGGRLDPSDNFIDRFTQLMQAIETAGEKIYKYRCSISFKDAGHFGLTIRITPNHPNPESRHAMGLAIWGQA
ncbi:MAG: alpha-glucan family phosphorylase [Deltaproteobacteria bacterium]|nr:alpha-glucan family phosphorylase [Deltaproteobacteria bacterium]